MPGVLTTGFVPLTLTEIREELRAAWRAEFGAEFDVSEESPAGQVIDIVSERVASLWDSQEGTYASFTRDGATGQSLDNIGALTGTPREAAFPSTVTATLAGTNGTVVPVGTVFAVQTTEDQFETIEEVTISGGAATVDCESVEDDAIFAPAATLTVIVTPIAGLTSVTNALDAVPGAPIEADAAYRRRQERELRAAGKAALEAIRDSLLQVEDVESATVFENDTDTTDGDGLPPHSIECLVSGGTDADVAEAIFSEKAAGISTYGDESESVTDSQGIARTIRFSRPDDLDVYIRFDLIVDPTTYPVDGEAQVQAAAVAYGDEVYVTGKNVVSSALAGQVVEDKLHNLGIAGVLEAIAKISFSAAPTVTTTLAIAMRERAVVDTSRITVFTTNGTP